MTPGTKRIINHGLVIIGLAILGQIVGPEFDAREKIKYIRKAMIAEVICKDTAVSGGGISVTYIAYPRSATSGGIDKINAEVNRSFKNIVAIKEVLDMNVPVNIYFDSNGDLFEFRDSRILMTVIFYFFYICIAVIHWASQRRRDPSLPKHRTFMLTKQN